jgi:hypothetical protein
MNLNVGPGADPKIDNWGHLGGGITGIFASIAITEYLDWKGRDKERVPDRFTEEEYERRSSCCKTWCCHWTGTILLTVWLLTLIIFFYAFVDVDSLEMEDIDASPP